MTVSIARFLILSIVLTACNLSATPATESLQVIISATPAAESTDDNIALAESVIVDITAVPIANSTQTTTQFVSEQSQSNEDYVYVGNPMPAPSNSCYVYTTGDFNVNIRVAQSETSAILGQLRANQWIPIRSSVNGWFGIDMPNTPVNGAYIANGATTLSSTCSCGVASCSTIANTGTCDVTSSATEVTSIYAEPANWSSIVGQLEPSTAYTAIAQSTSGWYELIDGGWVPPSFLRTPDTGCRHLPTITYDAPLFKCELVNTTDEIATILRAPDGEYFGRFAPNLRLGVIKHDGDWYQVYVAAFENAGWVDGSAMSLAGDCGDFE